MLAPSDQMKIRQCFNVYEHNWEFYQHLLGEAFLLDDVLAYFDGSALFVPLFSLAEPGREFSPSDIRRLIDSVGTGLNLSGVRIINFWGRFADLPESLIFDTRNFSRAEQSDYYPDAFDTVFDLHAHLECPSGSAKKRLRNLRAKGVTARFVKARQFSWQHRQSIECWMNSHSVSRVHREFIFSLEPYLQHDNVWLCEASLEGAPLGFSVSAIVSDSRLIILNSFPSRGPGVKAGDALFAAAIEFAQAKALRWIHRGYSATAELLWTKESWGAVSRGPAYREAFFLVEGDEKAAAMVAEGTFLWRQRIAGQDAPSGTAASAA